MQSDSAAGYQTKRETVAVQGVADLQMRLLLDRQQFHDPAGRAERLGISSAAWPLFGQLWPSGAELAARLALRPVTAGERILEMGCGLALASLVAHRRGANITASDCHPLAALFLRRNLRLNRLQPLAYRHGHWGEAVQGAQADPQLAAAVAGHFDLLIGSDLLYERDERGGLAAFIGRHAALTAEVWIVCPGRGNRAVFARHMAARGFDLNEERLNHPAQWRDGAGTAAYKGSLLVYRR